MPSRSIAIVGLGLMGTALAERFLEQGYAVRVWNRTPEKAAALIARGAEWADRPFADADLVLVSLYSSEVVRDVLALFADDLPSGQTIIDTTTGEPEHSRAAARSLAERGITYLDAPISGSSEVTRRGEATVMVAGERMSYERLADVWLIVGRQAFYVGPSGSAAHMKLVTNLVLGLNRAVLAEGLAFAEASGLDPALALEVLKGSPAYSRQMDAKGHKMIAGDYTVQARLSQHLKDVRLMLESAQTNGLPVPLLETHRRLLEQAEGLGLGDLDNSAIRQVWQRTAQ